MRPGFAAMLERIEGNGVRTMGDKVTSRTRLRRPKNLFLSSRNNLRSGCAVPCASNLYGVASHDCELVSTEIGELECSHRGWWDSLFFAFRFFTENGNVGLQLRDGRRAAPSS
jgi:hypothetical protein